MCTRERAAWICRLSAAALFLISLASLPAQAAPAYRVFVSNERSGDLTVIDGSDLHVVGTVAVGKRPRGLHASPDGKTLYVALSGTPIQAPPQLDAQGNPMFQPRKAEENEEKAEADKSADGIGIVDTVQMKLTGKIPAGSDPEEFALSKDGTRIYISNEDVKTASVINIATAKVEHIIPVGQEPEGVATTPDGGSFYVTCEAGGDVYVIDTTRYVVTAHFKVNVRPRTVAFQSGTGIGFIPSESTAELNVIDTANARVVKVITLPAGSRPMSVKVSPDGRRIYVSNGRAGTISVLDGHSYELLSTIQVGTRPWGMALAPDGRRLYVANGPSNDVSVVDLKTNQELARVKAGNSPWSVAVVAKPK